MQSIINRGFGEKRRETSDGKNIRQLESQLGDNFNCRQGEKPKRILGHRSSWGPWKAWVG